MLLNLKDFQIILASNSPRRKQLLKEIIPEFSVQVKEVEEIAPPHLFREEIAVYLSQLKSVAFDQLSDNEILITADTIVCLKNEVLNKPKDKNEAIQMLTKLSNETHTVYTGVTIRSNHKTVSFFDATEVTFYPITLDEINYYLDTCQPYDKAGSYGIQEWLGYVKIKKMNGEFYNVMGLPVHRLYQELIKW
jgi:septum formation protein